MKAKGTMTMELSEITMEVLQEEIDWKEVHRMVISSGTDIRIEFRLDGDSIDVVEISRNSWQPGVKVIGSINGWGRDFDLEPYHEGCAIPMKDAIGVIGDLTGDYLFDDGRIMTEEDMIEESIEYGVWDDLYYQWCVQLLESIEILIEYERQDESQRVGQEEWEKENEL